jgi:hypothetical protein
LDTHFELLIYLPTSFLPVLVFEPDIQPIRAKTLIESFPILAPKD